VLKPPSCALVGAGVQPERGRSIERAGTIADDRHAMDVAESDPFIAAPE
jgi:hypothetical protein